jgi:phage head maturation protease
VTETETLLLAEATDTADTVTVTPEDQAPPLVAESTRTITGRVLPWDELGRTTNGVLKFAAGAVNVPTEINRVKLLAGHSPTGVPIGHATEWHSEPDGLYMTFRLGSSPEADRALTAAAEHIVDAFSIEAYGIEREGTTVTSSIMSAVALVPMPAFASARVETINAAAPHPDPDPVPAVTDAGDDVEDPDAEDADRDEDEDDEDTPADPADTEPETEETTMPKSHLTPGVLPGQSTTRTVEPVHASLSDVTGYLRAATQGQPTDGLMAELTDITDAGMIDRAAPAWLGELWSGVTYTRRIIPHLTQANLTSRKVVGYRWEKKPGVGPYAGNKKEIPSFPAAVKAVERDAVRWAGGNDLDRAFWDFGETEFLNAYWRAMAESYAFETDQAAGKFVVDNATALGEVAENIIQAVARGSIAIEEELHSPADFVLINPADFEDILQLTNLDAPKYLDLIPATDPGKWVTSKFVPTGTVVLGTKTAATHYELSGSPLRVEAEHIAKGGRDAALFGYTALMLNRPEGLRKVEFAPSLPFDDAGKARK